MKNMKKKLIVFLSTCLVASSASAMALMSASADASTVDKDRFAMGELATGGVASIRLVEPRGLRFVAEIGQNIYTDLMSEEDGVAKKMGMYIVPFEYLNDATKFSDGSTGVSEKNYENLTQKLDYVFYDSANSSVENKIYKDGDYYYANGVIGDLYLQNYDRVFVGIAYIAETANGETEYTFTEVDETVARTATYVAEAAYVAATDATVQTVLNEYVVGAHLYQKNDLVENRTDAGKSYTYNGTEYNTLKEVTEAANLSFDIELNETEVFLSDGQSVQLVADVTEDGESIAITTNVLWNSSNESVATVDETGKVTYAGEGEATITATFLGETAECTVTNLPDKEKEVAELLKQKTTMHTVRQFYKVDFTAEVVDSATFGKPVPDGAKWLTKYDATLGATAGINQWGAIAQLLNTDLTSFADKNELVNSYVGFWIYTDIQNAKYSNVTIDKFVTSADTTNSTFKVTVMDSEWTYVEFSLSDILNGEAVRTLYITAKYTGQPEGAFNETLYIAGFDIYQQSYNQTKMIADKTCDTFSDTYGTRWYALGFETSVISAESFATETQKTSSYKWLTKYVATKKGPGASNTFGAVMYLSESDLSAINSNIDIENDYIGFYVYTDKNTTEALTVELYGDKFGTSSPKATKTIVSREWTYVEFKLSDIVSGGGNAKVCIALKYTGRIQDDDGFIETLYIAGFDIYAQSKNA